MEKRSLAQMVSGHAVGHRAQPLVPRTVSQLIAATGDWDEDLHPRDEHGQFTEGGGAGEKAGERLSVGHVGSEIRPSVAKEWDKLIGREPKAGTPLLEDYALGDKLPGQSSHVPGPASRSVEGPTPKPPSAPGTAARVERLAKVFPDVPRHILEKFDKLPSAERRQTWPMNELQKELARREGAPGGTGPGAKPYEPAPKERGDSRPGNRWYGLSPSMKVAAFKQFEKDAQAVLGKDAAAMRPPFPPADRAAAVRAALGGTQDLNLKKLDQAWIDMPLDRRMRFADAPSVALDRQREAQEAQNKREREAIAPKGLRSIEKAQDARDDLEKRKAEGPGPLSRKLQEQQDALDKLKREALAPKHGESMQRALDKLDKIIERGKPPATGALGDLSKDARVQALKAMPDREKARRWKDIAGDRAGEIIRSRWVQRVMEQVNQGHISHPSLKEVFDKQVAEHGAARGGKIDRAEAVRAWAKLSNAQRYEEAVRLSLFGPTPSHPGRDVDVRDRAALREHNQGLREKGDAKRAEKEVAGKQADAWLKRQNELLGKPAPSEAALKDALKRANVGGMAVQKGPAAKDRAAAVRKLGGEVQFEKAVQNMKDNHGVEYRQRAQGLDPDNRELKAAYKEGMHKAWEDAVKAGKFQGQAEPEWIMPRGNLVDQHGVVGGPWYWRPGAREENAVAMELRLPKRLLENGHDARALIRAGVRNVYDHYGQKFAEAAVIKNPVVAPKAPPRAAIETEKKLGKGPGPDGPPPAITGQPPSAERLKAEERMMTQTPAELKKAGERSINDVYFAKLPGGEKVVVKPENGAYTDNVRKTIETGRDGEREMASMVVNDALGGLVDIPPGINRDLGEQTGPGGRQRSEGQRLGRSFMQEFRKGEAPGQDMFGVRPVFKGKLKEDELAALGLFDAVVGNLDRHGGNGLLDATGHFHTIDQGLTFPRTNEGLRGWQLAQAERPQALSASEKARLEIFEGRRAEVDKHLGQYLAQQEIDAMWERVAQMRRTGKMYPAAPRNW